MKIRALFFVSTLFAAGVANAQSGGYYEFIPYYGNDPFKFCMVGVPWHCWAPVNPATGQFTVTNQYCFNPTSAMQYARVCPKAYQPGGGSNAGGGNRGGAGGRLVQQRDLANASP